MAETLTFTFNLRREECNSDLTCLLVLCHSVLCTLLVKNLLLVCTLCGESKHLEIVFNTGNTQRKYSIHVYTLNLLKRNHRDDPAGYKNLITLIFCVYVCAFILMKPFTHITGVIICGCDSQIVCVSIYYYTCTIE